MLSNDQLACGLAVASITLSLRRLGLRFLLSIARKGAPDVVGLFEVSALVPTHVTLVSAGVDRSAPASMACLASVVPRPVKVQRECRTKARMPLMPRSLSAPTFVEPMAAKVVEDLPEGEQWLYEVKWDG